MKTQHYGNCGVSGPSRKWIASRILASLMLGAALCPGGIAWAQPAAFSGPLSVLERACASVTAEGARGDDLVLSASADIVIDGQVAGWRATLTGPVGDRYLLQSFWAGRQFSGARLEWSRDDRPVLFLAADGRCRVQAARRMVYDEEGRASHIVHLDEQLGDTEARDLLNPPVPEAPDPGGIAVAMVDAGVNYTLAAISGRLARDGNGDILGYDFWDMDRRPFDANPAQSPFFPQRHGTRTASLLLAEAPEAALVPYRYPRPDMSRMHDVVEHAARSGVFIVGMPLGSAHKSDWVAFARAARAHRTILFIVSAGNRGVDIDVTPSYPASLDLDNMIVVTSADDSGGPAQGSNWGPRSVDLLVPAERRTVLGFEGAPIEASGSSYAVSRIAALAARLRKQHPAWEAPQLKRAIFARAVGGAFRRFVAVGYLPDPLAREGEVTTISRRRTRLARGNGALLHLSVVLIENAGWAETAIPGLMSQVDLILGQCGIRLGEVETIKLKVSDRLLDFDAATSHTLIERSRLRKPAVILVRDTLRRPAFEAEAFGRANSGNRDWLEDTAWLTAGMRDPAVGLAHELIHLLSNSGEHSNEPGNLMREQTSPKATALSPEQCARTRGAGLAHGLLVAE